MKTILKTSGQLLLLCSSAVFCSAQVWTYDFGTTAGVDTSSVASTSFLPVPGSGVARVRVGVGPVTGSMTLSNPGLAALGSNSELQIKSSTGSVSPTKFSVYDYTAGKIGYVKFNISFWGGTDGGYNFSLGDGSSYSDNSSMNTNHVFAGLRWSFGALNTINYQVLNNGSYVSTGITNAASLFVQDTSIVYAVEVYANNSSVPETYVKKGIGYILSADSWDLWVNEIKVGSALPSGALADNSNLDSYGFTHQSNALFPGTVYLDDIEYANLLPTTSLTVSTSVLANFGSLNVGSVSASSFFIIGASNLTGDVLVTAPGNIQLSRDIIVFDNTIVLPQTNGVLTGQPDTIYVRYAPVVSGWLQDSIVVSTPGMGAQKVAVSGTGISLFSNSSDIVEDVLFIYPQQIPYLNYQDTNLTYTTSLEVVKFVIRDGGFSLIDADALGTTLTDITLQITNPQIIRKIAIYDGTMELVEKAPASITRFSGLSIFAADGSTKQFSIRVSFLRSVSDQTQIAFLINNVVTSITGSIMSAVNAGGASSSISGNANRIAVLADRIVFAEQPSTTNMNDTMNPFVVIRAVDPLGNLDADFNQAISLVSTGILQSTPMSVNANAGVAIFAAIIHQATGTNIHLYATSGSFASITSVLFEIQKPKDTLVCFPTSWSGTPASISASYQDPFLTGTVTMTRGAALVAASSSTRFNSSNWSLSPILVMASNNAYLSFTITTATAYELNLNNALLSFDLSSSATGPVLFGVYSSVGGFSSTTNQIGADLTVSNTGIVFPSSGYDHLSSIEIRIYGWNASATLGTGGFSSMELVGTNTAIRYVFNGTWTPADPSGVISQANDINILSGNALITADSYCSNITIENGASLTISSGTTLTITGAISGFGVLTGNTTANLVVNGSGSFGVLHLNQTSSSTRALGSLTINRNNGSVFLGDSLDIYDSLSITNGTFYPDGKLRLKSTVLKTAVIPEIKGTGLISGNIIAEQFIAGIARRWRFMSSPFSNATFEDLRQEIYITGAGTGNTAGTLNNNGFDATLSNQPSVYAYNETASGNLNAGWVALTNTTPSLSNQLMIPGKGYRIFIRGDRSDIGRLTGTNPTQNQVVVNATGAINKGNIIIPVSYTAQNGQADDGWNLVGNPYPCALNWQAYMDNGTFSSFIDSTIYILDALSGSYKSYNAFSGGGTLTKGIIPKGASFWVKANAPNPSLVFAEQFKTTQASVALFKTSQNDELSIQLELDSITSDVFVLAHHAASSTNKDRYDIRKLNGEINIMSIGADGISLTYDVRPFLSVNDTVNLYVSGGNYTYSLKVNSAPVTGGRFYYLRDKKLNTLTFLSSGISYSYTSTNADTASFGYRFQLIIANNITLPVTFQQFKAIPSGSSVLLDWTAVSNTAEDRYEVERQTQNILDWKQLAVIDPQKGVKRNQYRFVDENPDLFGLNYYRIKCINYSHQVCYSIIQVASVENPKNANICVSPNPTNGCVNIISSEPIKEITVTDTQGKPLLSVNGKELHLDAFKQGMYLLKIAKMNGEVCMRRVVKN